ncbi:hypothetical protein [uncultured Alistipes sp.]|uniref:hypothetical protein n=1 Tax=uncultured Alistipes sp. TaxID=538949 RepID=UPI0025DDDD8C|nr:hypothetical protein [uncultured Alistipes sp.]
MKKYAFILAAFALAACNSGEKSTVTEVREPVAQILEYTPAPGQFINEELPVGAAFDNVDTPEKACAYVVKRFANTDWVSLGGWGGYIVAAFDQPVPNTDGYDLYVIGNPIASSSEPGIVWVMQDKNGNGIPDDTWYELKGSEYDDAGTIFDYQVTYTRPAGDNEPVTWTDSEGDNGTIDRISEHTQASYYPKWITSPMRTYTGTRLRKNVSYNETKDIWETGAFAWGYADNYSSIDRKGMTNRFRIADAVTADGQPARLRQIDFIKVQTGVNAKAELIGEISTEVCGIGCYRMVRTDE